MGKCYNCRDETNDFLCPVCRDAVRAGSLHLTFPGVCGAGDGPGSGANEMVYWRDDTYNETRLTLKKMEEQGRLDTPEKRAKAETILARAEKYRGQRVDRQKTGDLF